jgi:hypothetical protein
MSDAITVNPNIPADIINDTFEGKLLSRMAEVWGTTNGTYTVFVSARRRAETYIKPKDLQPHAEASETRLAKAALPLITQARSEGDLFDIRDLGTAVGKETFGLEDLLQEICRLHGDRIPYFEVKVAPTTQSSTEVDMPRGGAQFITADRIATLDTDQWLAEQRQAFLHNQFHLRMEWEPLEPGKIAVDLPHSTWTAVVHDHPKNKIIIKSVGDRHEIKMWSADTDSTSHYATHASLNDAMQEGLHLLGLAEASADDEILESMGLTADEWDLEYGADNHLSAFWHGKRNHEITWMPAIQSRPGCWVFRTDSEELVSSPNPWVVADFLSRHGSSIGPKG